jgi:hypothetical protein
MPILRALKIQPVRTIVAQNQRMAHSDGSESLRRALLDNDRREEKQLRNQSITLMPTELA